MKKYLALASALMFAACTNDGGTAANTDPQPGQIQLVQGLSKISSSSVDSSASYVFNLDTIKSSVQDEFILQNTGDYDVKSIKLTTNNPHFYFSPSEIPVLSCSKKSLILQVIKLNVLHGVILNGVGYTDMLPMGANTATVQITATTTNAHHDSLTISQNATLKTFAKVADMAVYSGSSQVNLSNPSGSSTTGNVITGFVPWYATSISSIKNTGNTDLKLKNWTDGDSVVLKSDSIWSVTSSRSIIEVNTLGVISDPNKLLRSADGRIVLNFHTL